MYQQITTPDPMPINPHDAEYQASVRRARADCIASRKRHGLNPDPNATHVVVGPRQLIRMWPLQVNPLPVEDRSKLDVLVDELIEQGYTTTEIRRALDLVDAANEGDSY